MGTLHPMIPDSGERERCVTEEKFYIFDQTKKSLTVENLKIVGKMNLALFLSDGQIQ